MNVSFGPGSARRWRAGEGDAFVTGLEVRVTRHGPITRTRRLPFRFEAEFTTDRHAHAHRCVLHVQAVPLDARGEYRLSPVACELAAAAPHPLDPLVLADFPLDRAMLKAVLAWSRNSDGTAVTRKQALALLEINDPRSSTDRKRELAAEAYFGARHGHRQASVALALGYRPDDPADIRAVAQFIHRAKKTPIWAEVAATYEGES